MMKSSIFLTTSLDQIKWLEGHIIHFQCWVHKLQPNWNLYAWELKETDLQNPIQLRSRIQHQNLRIKLTEKKEAQRQEIYYKRKCKINVGIPRPTPNPLKFVIILPSELNKSRCYQTDNSVKKRVCELLQQKMEMKVT